MNSPAGSEFPFEKGAQIVVQHDRFLLILFTGIVAGLSVLLMFVTFSFWMTLWFLLAELSAVFGVAACLLHMVYSAQAIGLLAEKFGDPQTEPNLIGSGNATAHDLTKIRTYAQLCYAGQLKCLFASVCFVSLGIVARVWHSLGWAGLSIAIVLAAGLVIAAFRPSVWVEHDARVVSNRQTSRAAPADAPTGF